VLIGNLQQGGFTDELSFVSGSDKDWATGHAMLGAPEREGATK
jgi:hypothetical protein